MLSYQRPTKTSAPVITLRDGSSWCRIYTTPGTLYYREVPSRTDNGRLYTYEVKGWSPDDNPEKGMALDTLLATERVLVRFCDNKGLQRLAGTPDEFLLFSYEFDTQSDVPDQRGYTITVSGSTTTRAPYAA
ncbi:hypothetical protein [Spirosoma sordidisoli]|uniref:Uncharacterized protein n=1 Tax=Spirosoma sordidisoli TaxID=2502893 RepID=A0A4Q2UKM3_9BACT|nr:hypothetical protein [Spirosoma sordidisoli]RYC69766.1 hypothetical protein EQG79_14315 [Spirosoma sordidisoli]